MKTLSKLLLCCVFVACSTNQQAGTGTPELDTTETALATGAVIGAGVGALVGSTAGEAGAGVVLGSIAGATSGGLIGKGLENQERRIDKHDARSGLNTRTASASARSSLAETIWSSGTNNRPSGSKGIASRYVNPGTTTDSDIIPSTTRLQPSEKFVQIRQERSVQDLPTTPKTISATSGSTTAKSTYSYTERNDSKFPAAATNLAPTIELQKPKPELPSLTAVPTRKPTLLGTANLPTSSTLDKTKTEKLAAIKLNADKVANKNVKDIKESSRAKLAEVKDKTAQKIEKNIPVEQKKVTDMAKAPNVALPAVEEVKEATQAKVEEKVEPVAKAIKPVAPQVTHTSVCDAGSKDYDRASNASSDSDKVFYLRRVILACPKEAGPKLQLGKVYSKLGLKDEAKKEFNSVLEVDPANESAQDEMSIMMLDSRKN